MPSVAGCCPCLQPKLHAVDSMPMQGKGTKDQQCLIFPGFDLCPEDSSHMDLQPHNGTESASCNSLALRTHNSGTAGGSERDPQLLLTQQEPFNMKSCKLSWWKLMSNQPRLPGSKANGRQRDGNGLSLPQAQGRLVCAV